MSKFNDLDIANWRELNINTDSLWMINEREKSGKHKNIYHGNFIPQIPHQLIERYTKKDEIVFEPFMGSGTTAFECETLNRRYIGIDINSEMVNYVQNNVDSFHEEPRMAIHEADCTDIQSVNGVLEKGLATFDSKQVQFILMHPPYMDIVKFTENPNDLSKIGDISTFVKKLKLVCENTLVHLEKNRYFGLVIGDVYKNSEVLPLGFYCMDMIKRNFQVKLKGIIVKNIEGNRGKIGQNSIWKVRALRSDYFIFKHEYIFLFKKEF